MKIEEWVFTGLDIALKAGKTVDDLCLFLKTADGLRQIMGVTEFKQTNGQTIRQMTDVELATFFWGFVDGSGKTVEQWRVWLKQEVKE